jgi:DNA replication protein
MTSFAGFPSGKTRFTPVPDRFFVELLGQIDNLPELKLTLYMVWCLNRQRGYPRYMAMPELEAEGVLLSALLCGADGDPVELLHTAVQRAVHRGTLLALCIGPDGDAVDYVFLNTPQGRKAVAEVRAGALLLDREGPVQEPHIARERPHILDLYEQNIGLLPPLLAEELLEAEDAYPATWITDAFRIAAENNARNWRYIKSILERWASRGKDEGFHRRSIYPRGLHR